MKSKRTSKDPKQFYLITLGCSKNQVDSEALEVDLLEAGMNKTSDPESADLILLNSCGFIRDAKIETIDTAFELHKKRKKDSILVLCGCLPARYSLAKSLPEIDIFLPSNRHDRLLSILSETGWIEIGPQKEIKRVKPTEPFGYLKISEGCDNYCSYCAIPYIKGSYHSKPMDDLVREAEFLSSKGVKELVLTGQDTTRYGRDYKEESGLSRLFDRLVSIPDIKWIRLMYAHPAHIDRETIEAIASHEKLVKYIDLPLQHINDRILGLMNRKIDRNRIETLLRDIRSIIPGVSIRTTFIVGFPGETDSDFGELLDFCEMLEFDHVGIFKYSVEDGTMAERLKGRIDEEVIEERFLTLLDLQNRISGKLLKDRVGKAEKVLLHEIDKDGTGYGRSWFQAPEVDGQVVVESCQATPGEFVDVALERSDAYDLYGTLKTAES